MELVRLLISIAMGLGSAAAMLYIYSLREQLKEMRRELESEREERLHAENAYIRATHDLNEETVKRARAEWELTQTKTAVHRVGWSQKWN